ncbi:MAG TPA: carbamoyltransferase C-terminal domain-containing protein [Gemmatimonadaceae bacterium]|nr:carbamoyltransferase C-terminal domain-containing protein [Gemmatimonadaceae bacterium]
MNSVYTLGINAVFHDSAAALVRDGEIVAAAEEERFSRIKHAKRPVPFSAWELPYDAIDYCLREAGIELRDVDQVAYSFDPSLLPFARSLNGGGASIALPLEPSAHPAPAGAESPWEPLMMSYVVNAPRQLVDGVPLRLARRFRGARVGETFEWRFVPHHLAHAASAFHASPFERAAVMTLDGRGERATTTYFRGDGNSLEQLGEVTMPDSLGLLYERVTSYLGFLHSSDEYKVMALASYGTPRYADEFRSIVQPLGEGCYRIHPPRLRERFGEPRERGAVLEQKHFDIARSLQLVLEETVLDLADWLADASGEDKLCTAGGVALNCVLNAVLRDRGKFSDIWVQPASGDSGTALGAALWADAERRPNARRHTHMANPYLGPGYDDDEIESFLRWSKLPYRRMDDVAEETAAIIAAGKIVGWFQGRMEFGPRALGARSILASPIDAEMQAKLNEIKDREDFRPVAPAVTEEEANRWFVEGGKNAGGVMRPSPFMLFVVDVRPEAAPRIPAVRHTDGTARVQTVSREENPLYHDMIAAFGRRTGVPVVINTSFNTRGEPVVCTPRDAVECYHASPLDALVIGSFVLEKGDAARANANGGVADARPGSAR